MVKKSDIKDMNVDYKKLMIAAGDAAKRAYSPYSGVSVGAALLAASGTVYTGANIENASYSAGICAERVAFASAVAAGEREFIAMVVYVTGAGKGIAAQFPPCGICLQFMREFTIPEKFEVVLGEPVHFSVYKLKELLPMSFGPDNINIQRSCSPDCTL